MNNHLLIKIHKLENSVQTPKRGTEYSAGYDLCANESLLLLAGERKLIKTGISLEIPSGYYGRIAPRSGIALKYGIDVLAGVIDSDYRGEIGVILYNTDKNYPFSIHEGDRIAQLIIEKHYSIEWNETESLKNSDRGSGGFGHTGNK